MTANLSFFDIAAGLIPVLLLGVAATDRVRSAVPSDPRALPKTLGGYLALYVAGVGMIFVGFAEVLAISAALSDDPSDGTAWIVAGVVAGGTWALAATIAWPWVEVMYQPRVPVGHSLPRWLKISRAGLILAQLGLVAVTVQLLHSSIEVEATNPQPDAFTEAILRDLDADDQLLDAQVAAKRMPTKLSKQLHLINARARAKLTEQLVETRGEKALDSFD
jgi:hypothetical protein